MTRSDSLPVEVLDWWRRVPQDEFRRRLADSFADRAPKSDLRLDAGGLSQEIETLDSRYFDAQDAGKENEAIQLFKHARLLSALRFLLDGKDEEALYEFFHSLDDTTPAALFSALQPG